MAHVLNRGNARAQVFHTEDDYAEFVDLLNQARERSGVGVLAFCLMPNHFHLVTQVTDVGQLSAMMQRWMTTHVRRVHKRRGTEGQGHIWQGRFKSFPIQQDAHLLTVLRYVYRNPVRAGLVADPFDWRWSSLCFDQWGAPWPVPKPVDLREWLNASMSSEREDDVRLAIRRSAPFGEPGWCEVAAKEWGIEPTLRPIGRPATEARP